LCTFTLVSYVDGTQRLYSCIGGGVSVAMVTHSVVNTTEQMTDDTCHYDAGTTPAHRPNYCALPSSVPSSFSMTAINLVPSQVYHTERPPGEYGSHRWPVQLGRTAGMVLWSPYTGRRSQSGVSTIDIISNIL